MKSDRAYVDYVEDIADAIQKVKQFIAGMNFEQFKQDDKTTLLWFAPSKSSAKPPNIFRIP